MRKITKESVNAFLNHETFNKANMQVVVEHANLTVLKLHGNIIAKIESHNLFITSAGWETNTTKERLNVVLQLANRTLKVFQKDFTWYLWDYSKDITSEFKDGWNKV